jgi:hypothetical protein
VALLERFQQDHQLVKDIRGQNFELKSPPNKNDVDSDGEDSEEGPEAYVSPFATPNDPPSYSGCTSTPGAIAGRSPPVIAGLPPIPAEVIQRLASEFDAVERRSPFQSPHLRPQGGAPLLHESPPPLLPLARYHGVAVAGDGLPPPRFGGDQVGMPPLAPAMLQPALLAPPPRRAAIKINRMNRALRLLAPHGVPGRLERREARAYRAPRQALRPPPPGIRVRHPVASRWYYEAI